jgi:1-deoxy-D-xylulose-5-phosphate synthase
LENGLKLRPMTLPDRFIQHNTPKAQYADAGLDTRAIVATALGAFGRAAEKAPARAW